MLDWDVCVEKVAGIAVETMTEEQLANFLSDGGEVCVPEGYIVNYLPNCDCQTCVSIREGLRELGVVVPEPTPRPTESYNEDLDLWGSGDDEDYDEDYDEDDESWDDDDLDDLLEGE